VKIVRNRTVRNVRHVFLCFIMFLNISMIGLLAAVMLVPGTAQREVTKVGEEPKVKEETVVKTDPTFWVKVNDDNIITDILGYVDDVNMPTATGGCNNQGNAPCARGYDSEPDLEIDDEATGFERTWNKAP